MPDVYARLDSLGIALTGHESRVLELQTRNEA
jgi:hypothetical protein